MLYVVIKPRLFGQRIVTMLHPNDSMSPIFHPFFNCEVDGHSTAIMFVLHTMDRKLLSRDASCRNLRPCQFKLAK